VLLEQPLADAWAQNGHAPCHATAVHMSGRKDERCMNAKGGKMRDV